MLSATAGIALASAITVASLDASVVPDGGHASAVTKVYNLQARVVFTLVDGCDQRSEESCAERPARNGTIYVKFTHTVCGGAVRVARSTWEVWSGRRLVGTIVKRDRRRADLYSRTGRKTGYSIGPEPVAAIAVHLLDVC